MPALRGGATHSMEPADRNPNALVMARKTAKLGRKPVEQVRFE